MAIKKSDAVKFVYVNGNSLPSKVDDATIYIIGGTQELYVGNLKIAASIDVDSALSTTSTNPVENQAVTKELNKKATIESPTFTGVPNASTAAAGTSTTQIATTAFVQNAVTAATVVVDDALNATSTNPVQNKVIKEVLDAVASLDSPTFTGTPKAPTAAAGTDTTQIATTAFVKTAVDNAAVTVDSSLSDSSTNPVQNKIIKSALDGKANTGDIPTATSTTPKIDGTAAVGTETTYARGDHVHPKDTTKANLASPTFTGTPNAPTATKGTSTTQIATTAYVQTELGDYIKDSCSAPVAYGTCTDAGDVVNKTVTITDNPDWELEVGSILVIKHTNKNSATNPTFNVNNTGNIPIGYNNSDANSGWAAGEAGVTSLYVYNGTCYMWMGHSKDLDTTYTQQSLGQGYGTCSTAAGTVAKAVTLSGYALVVNGIVSVKFTNAVDASSTMNINGKGAKAIYWKGSAITADVILAGDTATFIYNGSQYHLIAIDRWGNEATTSVAGLMSASDKTKLDGIATGANKTVVDSAMSDTSTNPVQNKVVKQAISDAIAASDAMIFKGTLGTGGTITALPTTYKTGWTYRVITAGTYAGNTCEVGDLIIALTNRSGSGNVNADWTVAQTNIDGAITSIGGKPPISVTGSGSRALITHADSGVTAASKGDTTNQTPAFGGTFKVPSATVDAKGHLTALADHTVKIPNATATTSANGLMSSTDKIKLDGIAEGANAYTHPSYTARTGKPTGNQTPAFGGTATVSQITSDASGHITGATDRTIKIPNTVATTSAPGLMSAADKTKLDGITDIPVPIASGGTSATTKLDAANSLEVETLANGIEIAENTDLNTLTTIGNYYTSNTALVATLLNCPTGKAFKLSVGKSVGNVYTGYLYQKLVQHNTGDTYYRYMNSGTINTAKWTAWVDKNGYLPLTGGTIAAATETAANVNNKNMLADVKDAANNVTSASVSSNSVFYDKNSQKVSALENRFEPDGNVAIRLAVRNWVTDSSKFSSYNMFDIGMTKAGNAYYTVSAPAVLKYALGIGYCTCDTAAATAAKVVTPMTQSGNDGSSFKLSIGSYIAVKFDNTNTAASPTMNVGGTGAKSIVYGTSTIVSDNLKYAGTAGIVMYYVYDGTNWVWLGQSQDENNTGYLPLTGGTITGNVTEKGILTVYREGTTTEDLPSRITFQNKDTTTGKTYSKTYISAYQDHASTTNGTTMVLNPGGGMIVGAGEAAETHYTVLKGENAGYVGEAMWLTADDTINLQAGANGIANRKGARITTAGEIVPIAADVPTNNVQSIGTTDYKWKSMYATTFYGALSGNASTATSAGKLTAGSAIDGVTFDGSTAIVHYGTCSTAAGTAAKVVACTSFTLVTGSTIRVKFTVTNTAASPTLNVNSTGAKNIFYKGAAITAGYLIKDHVYEFVYDGTQYCLVGEIYSATTTSIGSASAGTAIAADDITAWSAGTAASASVANGVLTITNGTAPSLTYTARSIPNISVTSKTVVTGI